MINKKSLQEVKQTQFSKKFCRPLYHSYCFSQIPKTIERLCTNVSAQGLPEDVFGENFAPFEKVILIFLDGFGWTFFEKYKSKLPLLNRLEEEGVASKITSMFPSTTAAHVTCINTGLDASQSGIYEWFIYEPKLNEIIAPLPYSFAGDHKFGTLQNTSITPEELFPQETLFQSLREKEVASFAFQSASISNSPYSKKVLSGAEIISYSDMQNGLEKLLEVYRKQEGKSYFYFYFGDIDAIGHRKGIFAKEFSHVIEETFSHLEHFVEQIEGNTALIITADHGMVEIDPQNTYYLNKKIPNLEKNFLLNAKQKPLAPAGSCRDFFLHLREETLSETKEILEHFLEGIAEVYFTKDLIQQGIFGPKSPSERFLKRVGNLVILPYKGEAVWWFEKNRFMQNFYAAHGGMTREEMETLFLFNAFY